MDYKVSVQRVAESEGANLKAFASATFEDSFKVTGIRLLCREERGRARQR